MSISIDTSRFFEEHGHEPVDEHVDTYVFEDRDGFWEHIAGNVDYKSAQENARRAYMNQMRTSFGQIFLAP